MKCDRDLSKKKKIKTRNNEMAKNTNLSTVESKKANENRITYMESVLMVARWEGCVGEWVKR